MTTLTNITMHLGGLHPYETLLLFVLAFGPFVVLAFVVTLRRRHDIAREKSSPADDAPP
jgi:hypothetical protein